MNTYYIRLYDIYGDCSDIVLKIKTKRTKERTIAIIENAMYYWQKYDLDVSKWEYVVEKLNKHFNNNWEELDFINLEF